MEENNTAESIVEETATEKQSAEDSKEEEKARREAEKEAKRKETLEKVKKFLIENKDVLILSGQLALVTIVCVAGIKNDITPEWRKCCKKKKKKKRK